ncbi:MAG: GNAT family N-acetyltransferase [Flavobacteriales bacterium]|nr:GNAT family N-acetyltransferase [Flavobacteriales bacterium]
MSHRTFETTRTQIRPTNEDDAEFVVELFNSPKWLKFIGDRKVRTAEDAKEYISKKMTPQLDRLGFSNYTVIRKRDQAKIGTCGLYDRDGLDGVDMGFAFLSQFEKQGYAFEASKKILEAAFTEFKLESVSAITIRENIDSQRLLEKLGFHFHDMTNLPDDPEDLMLYRIHKEEWKKNTSEEKSLR